MQDRIGEIIEIHSEIWHTKFCNLLLGNLNTKSQKEQIRQQLCHAEQQKSFSIIMVICSPEIFSLYLHWKKQASPGSLLAGTWICMACVSWCAPHYWSPGTWLWPHPCKAMYKTVHPPVLVTQSSRLIPLLLIPAGFLWIACIQTPSNTHVRWGWWLTISSTAGIKVFNHTGFPRIWSDITSYLQDHI